jgi:hypothetical protein
MMLRTGLLASFEAFHSMLSHVRMYMCSLGGSSARVHTGRRALSAT